MERSFVLSAVFLLVFAPAAVSGDDEVVQLKANPKTIGHLVFRVTDKDSQAMKRIHCHYRVHSQTLDDSIDSELTVELKDGILRVPTPKPKHGRIQLWITSETEDHFWKGYEDFSFDLDGKTDEIISDIALDEGVVLRGSVVSKQDGSPIANAEVAATHLGHHATWADWDEAVRTNAEGRFRLPVRYPDGIAARHEAFGEQELEFWRSNSVPEPLKLSLSPKRFLYGRVVDESGKPIEGVQVDSQSKTNADGEFKIALTVDQWRSREHQISFWRPDLQYHSLLSRSLSFDSRRRTKVTLKQKPRVSGLVIDAEGEPVSNAKVEIKEHHEFIVNSFTLATKLPEGQWEYYIDEDCSRFQLRVSVDNIVHYQADHRVERDQRIRTELPSGYALAGGFVQQLDPEDAPLVVLRDRDRNVLRVTQARGAEFDFRGLPSGTYRLEFFPANLRLHSDTFYDSDPPHEFTRATYEQQIQLTDHDVVIPKIDLTEANLLPGTVTGVARDPSNPEVALANGFVYLLNSLENLDTVGTSYYVDRVMTDSYGRFRFDSCPPGRYYFVMSESPHSHSNEDHGQALVTSKQSVHVVLEKRKKKKIPHAGDAPLADP